MDEECPEAGTIDVIEVWTEAIRRDPRDSGARMARGVAFVEAGDFERASADFAKALELDPKPSLRYLRGVDYLRMGEPGMAVAEFTNALAIDPDYLEALDRRAEAFRALDDRVRAALDERAALRLRAQISVRLRLVPEAAEPAHREAPLKRA